MGLFKKKENEKIETATPTPEEEWVWVEGYKGTDKDMKCQGFQYELGGKFSILKDQVVECKSGFHMCLSLSDVFHYYPIGNSRRYFKVRALVKKSDLEKYGTYPEIDMFYTYSHRFDKLVSAEIEFLDELTIDEILKGHDVDDWEDKYKQLAIEIGVHDANRKRKMDILTGFGYSPIFSVMLIDEGKFEIARSVGSQSDLSMDMKVWIIFHD